MDVRHPPILSLTVVALIELKTCFSHSGHLLHPYPSIMNKSSGQRYLVKMAKSKACPPLNDVYYCMFTNRKFNGNTVTWHSKVRYHMVSTKVGDAGKSYHYTQSIIFIPWKSNHYNPHLFV